MDQPQNIPLASRTERYAAGKALRKSVPREKHSAFTVDPDRDPMPMLTASDGQRLPSLVPERYKRMAASPFAFYRGGAVVMASDLATLPSTGLAVQACGDCHLMNFGAFLTAESRILFDINDFDETCPDVDFSVDLKRLTASVAVAAQNAAMPDKQTRATAQATVKAYRDFMALLAQKSPLEVWRVSMDLGREVSALANADLETKVLAKLSKAEKNAKPSDDFPDIQRDHAGGMAIGDRPPTIFHVAPDGMRVDHVFNQISLERYTATLPPDRGLLLARYALQDVAFKVVGVGSVGTFCAVGLLATADNEPLILQLKQSWSSAIAPLARGAVSFTHEGQRVVEGQRAMQAASDPFLGWTQDDAGRYFYIRQLKNRRLGSLAELMAGKALPAYAMLCGRTLARAHARTGDPAQIAGYMGKGDILDSAIADFAMAYAKQTVCDHAKLVAAKATTPSNSPPPHQ